MKIDTNEFIGLPPIIAREKGEVPSNMRDIAEEYIKKVRLDRKSK